MKKIFYLAPGTLLVGSFLLSLNAESGITTYQVVDEFPVVELSMPGPTCALASGVALTVDWETRTVIESVRGEVVREYSVPPLEATAAIFGPDGNRYIYFRAESSSAIHVYAPDGSLVRKIPIDEKTYPTAMEVNGQGQIVILGELNPAGGPLSIYRYSGDGTLDAHLTVGGLETGQQAKQQPSFTVSERGEIAVLKPDGNRVFWIDPFGTEIQSWPVPSEQRVTALKIVDDRLYMVVHTQTPYTPERPIVRSDGAELPPDMPEKPRRYIFKLGEPALVRLDRQGTTATAFLPSEALGINQIDDQANLLFVSRHFVRVLAPTP